MEKSGGSESGCAGYFSHRALLDRRGAHHRRRSARADVWTARSGRADSRDRTLYQDHRQPGGFAARGSHRVERRSGSSAGGILELVFPDAGAESLQPGACGVSTDRGAVPFTEASVAYRRGVWNRLHAGRGGRYQRGGIGAHADPMSGGARRWRSKAPARRRRYFLRCAWRAAGSRWIWTARRPNRRVLQEALASGIPVLRPAAAWPPSFEVVPPIDAADAEAHPLFYEVMGRLSYDPKPKPELRAAREVGLWIAAAQQSNLGGSEYVASARGGARSRGAHRVREIHAAGDRGATGRRRRATGADSRTRICDCWPGSRGSKRRSCARPGIFQLWRGGRGRRRLHGHTLRRRRLLQKNRSL